ncbi:Cwf18 pre-mRNA splicing factor [Plasmodiophora brassicae]
MADESTEERRRRLAALRAEAGVQPSGDVADGPAADEEEPQLRFRNYKPKAKELTDFQVGGDTVPDVDQAIEPIRQVASVPQDEMVSIAPRKPNWDLKRDVERDLALLQKRTQIAIANLARQLNEEYEEEEEEQDARSS